MDLKLRRYTINPDGSIQIEVAVLEDDGIVRVGDVVQVGVELPAIPGLRGHYLVSQTEMDWAKDEVATQTSTLVRASQENKQAHQESLIGAYIERDWGPSPDWTAVWDRLDFLPTHRRREALRQIQAAHRDRVDQQAKQQRLAELVAREADRKRAEAETEAREVVRQADEQISRERFEKFEGPKHRKIDLEDQP